MRPALAGRRVAFPPMVRLRLEEVRFAYGLREVLAGVTLEVQAGETVAVVGPNGSGKTTLLGLASGWLEPSGGRVLLDGEDLAGLGRMAAARRIAGVAVTDDVGFPYRVRDTVALGRHPWRGAFGPLSPSDQSAIDEALALTDLVPLADRRLPELSSGERRRAALARCLAQGGDVVLLDEPTAHLDLRHGPRLLAAFRARAAQRGQAVLAALHDLNLAASFADRIVLLAAGRIVAAGRPAAVLTPALIQAHFGAPVAVLAHPSTGAPVVVADAFAAKEPYAP